MTRWMAPPDERRVTGSEVHVWRASLSAPDEPLWQLLSADERERAARFRFERDRRRFVAGRAFLRELLGRYLGADPREVAFRYGSRGKPALDVGGSGIEFNVAHSGDLALYAFTVGAAVGIDVEFVRNGRAEEGIADQFFSPREAAALGSLPPPARREAFFRCWTRKEAFVKAIGEGLGFGLDQFSVSLLPDEPARLVETPQSPDEAAKWSLHHIDPADSYVGALAVRGCPERVHHWQV